MDKKYLITLLTTQMLDGEKNVIELTTHADLIFDSDGYTIAYTEHNEEDGEVYTRISVGNDRVVSVRREASVNSQYTIEEGVRHLSHHVAPFGSFSIGISGRSVETEMTPHGGTLDFRYVTDISMEPAGEFEFNITMKLKQ